MPDAVSNTSPLLYLNRIGVIDWLAEMFSDVWIPNAVLNEFEEGRYRGYDVPEPEKGLDHNIGHFPAILFL